MGWVDSWVPINGANKKGEQLNGHARKEAKEMQQEAEEGEEYQAEARRREAAKKAKEAARKAKAAAAIAGQKRTSPRLDELAEAAERERERQAAAAQEDVPEGWQPVRGKRQRRRVRSRVIPTTPERN